MKILQIIPRAGNKKRLKQLLKDKERSLRGSNTTFYRTGEGRWAHKTYLGWITWDEAPGRLLVAEVRTKRNENEWQLLQSFIGYLDRHLGEYIESITITYR